MSEPGNPNGPGNGSGPGQAHHPHDHGARGNARLSYHNDLFVESDDARPIRILAEYLEPLRRFRQERVHDTVVFFGSARIGPTGPFGRY